MTLVRNVIITQSRQLNFKKSLKNIYSSFLRPIEGKPEPPYKHVIQIGDPVLREHSDPVPKNLITSPEIQFLIKRMKYVFKRYDCVGLAAPQIGVNLRVIITEFNEKHAKLYSEKELRHKEMQYLPQTIIINPTIKVTNYDKTIYSEGCLSILGYSAEVPRYKNIQLTGFNENGEDITLSAHGWCARVIQHEVDHLNGILYTDIMNGKSFCCSGWDKINQTGGRVELRYDGD